MGEFIDFFLLRGGSPGHSTSYLLERTVVMNRTGADHPTELLRRARDGDDEALG